MRECDAIGQSRAIGDGGEDMLVTPVGERTLKLYIGEGVGRRSGFVARDPADGQGGQNQSVNSISPSDRERRSSR